MTPEQFSAIYSHLIRDARQSCGKHKMFGLRDQTEAGVIDGILFLPLYSLGIAAHGMEARVRHLKDKANGNGLDFFADGSLDELEKICDSKIQGGNLFGDFFNRLYEIRQRAKKVRELGVQKVETQLQKPEVFPTPSEFKEALKLLKEFKGISDVAAQHILMDCGWPIVKPDRHVQRILYRLGGWTKFVGTGSDNKKRGLEEWYGFQKKWKRCVDAILEHQDSSLEQACELDLPVLRELNSRKIDYCLMWFAQTQKQDNCSLGPAVCIADPRCENCRVPNCTKRKKDSVNTR
jgi:hypothetical protein